MSQARYPHRSPPKNGGPVPESSRRREIFAAVEASPSAVRKPKRAADESCGGRTFTLSEPLRLRAFQAA